eukprot:5679453-Amphidinium_carterae.1
MKKLAGQISRSLRLKFLSRSSLDKTLIGFVDVAAKPLDKTIYFGRIRAARAGKQLHRCHWNCTSAACVHVHARGKAQTAFRC